MDTVTKGKQRGIKIEYPFRCDYSLYPSEPMENAVCIPLSKGLHAIVSRGDYEKLGAATWHAQKHGYAVTNTPVLNGYRKQLKMHKLVLEEAPSIDHINGDKLDNRRCNLRECNDSQNQANKPKQSGNYSSSYKGVSWSKVWKKWQAYIVVKKKQIALGYYRNEEDAALAYNFAAAQYHGEFARYNLTQFKEVK